MNNEIEVLILVGGKGERLRDCVSKYAKPLALINNEPFLSYLFKFLEKYELVKVCLLTGYRHEDFEEFVENIGLEKFSIRFSKELKPLGTGGAIKKAIESSSFKKFLILNGDSFFNIDLNNFINNSKGLVNIALTEVNNCSRFGSVILNGEVVTEFIEKNKCEKPGLINTGVYFTESRLAKYLPPNSSSFEELLGTELTIKQLVKGYSFSGDFIDIGISEDYQTAQDLIPRNF